MGRSLPSMSKPNAWLHWTTKQNKKNVTTVDFLREARSKGILVSIQLKGLRKMSWNDEVCCIHKQEQNRSGSVFCKFPITRISGLTDEAMEAVVQQLSVSEVAADGAFADRLLGEYLELETWKVNATIQDISSVLKKVKPEMGVGRLSVGCDASEFSTFPPPWATLPGVKKFSDFRQFDGSRFANDAEGYRRTEIYQSSFKVQLESVYDANSVPTKNEGGDVQSVNWYKELDFSVPQLELPF